MKKVILFVSLISLLVSVPVFAKEQDLFTCDEYDYVLQEDGTAEIIDYNGMIIGKTKIPDKLDGHDVSSIGFEAFHDQYELTSITLPDSITKIGSYAFWGCTKLTNIDLPDTIEYMGICAFYNCYSLKSVTFPESITAISGNPFILCDEIELHVSPDHPYLAVIDGALFSKPDKRLIYCPSAIKEYVVPEGIRSIGDYALHYCEKLSSVSLPESVTNIGYGSFFGCDSLMNITIPDSVTEIGEGAFYSCDNLTSINLPSTITSIGDDAFGKCDKLTLTVERDSYAAEYCKKNGLDYTYPDANDWLTG